MNTDGKVGEPEMPDNQADKAPGEELTFALDIGTRSVIGVVGSSREELFHVHQVAVMEHLHRAVVDGQIEDIQQTARVAQAVKEQLEAQVGRPLRQVHVAAAGRMLKTQRISTTITLDDKQPLQQREIFLLESQAIQQAYEQLVGELTGEDRVQGFYCVGHSVVEYTLDGYPYSTLTGHRGRVAGVELIATFLPDEVVESLYSTMRHIDLQIASITLEPIAAISAVIPKELRLLNIALVDVGAGTSDIAVASGGSISAYTMATVAGDEITEQIMKELLVDFQTAERVKFELGSGNPDTMEDLEYIDILGLPSSVGARDLCERITPAIQNLADTIAQRILEANGKAPMAVFMVGGGSRTPRLCQTLAQSLGIEPSKIAIGGNNYMKRRIQGDDRWLGAEYATPMGIALTAVAEVGRQDFTVTLNGEPFSLQSGGSVTVMELLLRGGYQYGQIIGRSGKSISFFLGGEKKLLRGQLPTLAEIQVNGQMASITTPLQAGDVIQFTPAVNGQDADGRLGQVLEGSPPFWVTLDGRSVQAGTQLWVNDQPVDQDYLVQPMDQVRLRRVRTLGELLLDQNLVVPPERIRVGGQVGLSMDALLEPGDVIEILAQPPAPPVPKAAPAQMPAPGAAPDQQKYQPVRVTLNGSRVVLKPDGEGGPYFFDLLNYTDIDPADPRGEIIIKRNGRGASYIEPIQDGDDIEIYWSEQQHL